MLEGLKLFLWICSPFIVMFFVGMIMYKTATKGLRERGIMYAQVLNYCGGLTDIACDCRIDVHYYEDKIEMVYHAPLQTLKVVHIPYDKFLGVEAMTTSQLSERMTLTRMAVFGVFALALKKKEQLNKYLLIYKYIDDKGEEISLICDTAFGNDAQREMDVAKNAVSEFSNKEVQNEV